PAQEEVRRDRGPPRRGLDHGPAVVRVELVGALDLDVLDDRALARAVPHPHLGEVATAPATLPTPAARLLRRAVRLELGDAHRRAPRAASATAATRPAAASPARA